MAYIHLRMPRSAPKQALNRSELIIMKSTFVKSNQKVTSKANYIVHRPHKGYLNENSLGFDKNYDRVNADDFLKKHNQTWVTGEKYEKWTKAYDFVISFPPEFFKSEEQILNAARVAMEKWENKIGMNMNWMSSVHLQMEAKGEKKGEKKLNPHVHFMVSSVGEVRDLPRGSKEKKDRFIKFRRDEKYLLQNWFKGQIEGMKSVSDEKAFENESRIYEDTMRNRTEWALFRTEIQAHRTKMLKQRLVRNANRLVQPMSTIGKNRGGGGQSSSASGNGGLIGNFLNKQKEKGLLRDEDFRSSLGRESGGLER